MTRRNASTVMGAARTLRWRLAEMRLRQRAWTFIGLEKHTGAVLRLTYIGQCKNREYLCGLAYSEYECEERGRVWLGRLGRRSDLLHELVCIEGSDIVKPNPGSYRIPLWLSGEIDVVEAQERMRGSGNIKEDLRRIRKHGLGYELSKDPQTIEWFYRVMYVPHVSRVHGQAAAPIRLERLRRRMERCELLLIQKDGEYIAGEVLLRQNGRLRAWGLGVKDGDARWVRMGAAAALYYFKIVHASREGLRTIDVGASRPFLRDGVLEFKRKWGMRVTGARGAHLALFAQPDSPGVWAFLENNPFIGQWNGKLYATLFGSTTEPAGLPEGVAGIRRIGLGQDPKVPLSPAGRGETLRDNRW